MSYKYNRDEINTLLKKTLTEIGEEKFSGLGVVALERLIRDDDAAAQRLPGRTILREIMNNFRKERWPQTAPKRRS